MSMLDAKASNWALERFTSQPGGFTLTGSTESYAAFGRAFKDGDTVFYAAADDDGNREAGYGVYRSNRITERKPTATLINGAYNDTNPSQVSFAKGGTIAGTFNAIAFNTLWSHLSDEENPHNVTADQIPLDPELDFSDEQNVQKALEYIFGRFTKVQDDIPKNPEEGDLWFDTGHTAELYVYHNGSWISTTGAGGGGGSIPDNVVLDDIDGTIVGKLLGREIDEYGHGIWRQIYTDDVVTRNAQPMFRSKETGRFTKATDPSAIRDQQTANWFLYESMMAIKGGATVSDTPPADPEDGELWFNDDPDVLEMFMWHEGEQEWLPVKPDFVEGDYMPIQGGEFTGPILGPSIINILEGVPQTIQLDPDPHADHTCPPGKVVLQTLDVGAQIEPGIDNKMKIHMGQDANIYAGQPEIEYVLLQEDGKAQVWVCEDSGFASHLNRVLNIVGNEVVGDTLTEGMGVTVYRTNTQASPYVTLEMLRKILVNLDVGGGGGSSDGSGNWHELPTGDLILKTNGNRPVGATAIPGELYLWHLDPAACTTSPEQEFKLHFPQGKDIVAKYDHDNIGLRIRLIQDDGEMVMHGSGGGWMTDNGNIWHLSCERVSGDVLKRDEPVTMQIMYDVSQAITDWVDEHYVNVKGDTMTGALDVRDTVKATRVHSTNVDSAENSNLHLRRDGADKLLLGTDHAIAYTPIKYNYAYPLNEDLDLITKAYAEALVDDLKTEVDQNIDDIKGDYVKKAGDTMSGQLTVNDVVKATEIQSTKVDSAQNSNLSLQRWNQTKLLLGGSETLAYQPVKYNADYPLNDNRHLVTKGYVDGLVDDHATEAEGKYVQKESPTGDTMQGPLNVRQAPGTGSRDSSRIQALGLFSGSDSSALRLGTTRDRVYIGHEDTSFNGPVKIDQIHEKNAGNGIEIHHRTWMKNNRISGLGDPQVAADAVNLRTLDSKVDGLAEALRDRLDGLVTDNSSGEMKFAVVQFPSAQGQFTCMTTNGAQTTYDPMTTREIWANNKNLTGYDFGWADVKPNSYFFMSGPGDALARFRVVAEPADQGTWTKIKVADPDVYPDGQKWVVNDAWNVLFRSFTGDSTNLDDYVKKTGDVMTGTLQAPRLESKKDDAEAVLLVEGRATAPADTAARITMSNSYNANAYGKLEWHGTTGTNGWFQFDSDVDLSSHGLHSVNQIRFKGTSKNLVEVTAVRITFDGRTIIEKGNNTSGAAGFELRGRTAEGSNAKLLQVYHNAVGTLDAINYYGKQHSDTNILTVGGAKALLQGADLDEDQGALGQLAPHGPMNAAQSASRNPNSGEIIFEDFEIRKCTKIKLHKTDNTGETHEYKYNDDSILTINLADTIDGKLVKWNTSVRVDGVVDRGSYIELTIDPRDPWVRDENGLYNPGLSFWYVNAGAIATPMGRQIATYDDIFEMRDESGRLASFLSYQLTTNTVPGVLGAAAGRIYMEGSLSSPTAIRMSNRDLYFAGIDVNKDGTSGTISVPGHIAIYDQASNSRAAIPLMIWAFSSLRSDGSRKTVQLIDHSKIYQHPTIVLNNTTTYRVQVNFTPGSTAATSGLTHTMMGRGYWGHSIDELSTDRFIGFDFNGNTRNALDQYTYGIAVGNRYGNEWTDGLEWKEGAYVEVFDSDGKLLFAKEIDSIEHDAKGYLRLHWEYQPNMYVYATSHKEGDILMLKITGLTGNVRPSRSAEVPEDE